jgi:hypothetical protein
MLEDIATSIGLTQCKSVLSGVPLPISNLPLNTTALQRTRHSKQIRSRVTDFSKEVSVQATVLFKKDDQELLYGLAGVQDVAAVGLKNFVVVLIHDL